jgi:hypothetical protein
MSIKAIHIILISCAILLSLGFGLWSMAYAKSAGDSSYKLVGFASFVIGIGLIFYGIHFIKKAKSLS